MEKTALIVIDIQNDFCKNGSLAVPGGEDIVENVNKLMQVANNVVLTQDWHTRSHMSFASSWNGKKPFEQIKVGDIEQVLWPDHCIEGSHGADFFPSLETKFAKLILRKGYHKNIDSYSGFFENDKQTKTGLGSYLKELKINSIYLCGIAGDYCVYYTALDALKLGFKVSLIWELVRCVDPKKSETTLNNLIKNGAKIIEARNLI